LTFNRWEKIENIRGFYFWRVLYNGGSGNLTINNSGLGTNLLSLYSSAFTVPASGYALMTTDYIAVNSISTYFVKHN